MKNLNILSLLVIVALLFAVQPASAVVTVVNKETTSISKKELKKQERMEKMMDKIQKKMDKMDAKKGVDTSDPVKKWLWFAIFAWIAAIVLYILGWFIPFVWYLGYLASAAGTIFFIIWLLKLFEVM